MPVATIPMVCYEVGARDVKLKAYGNSVSNPAVFDAPTVYSKLELNQLVPAVAGAFVKGGIYDVAFTKTGDDPLSGLSDHP